MTRVRYHFFLIFIIKDKDISIGIVRKEYWYCS